MLFYIQLRKRALCIERSESKVVEIEKDHVLGSRAKIDVLIWSDVLTASGCPLANWLSPILDDLMQVPEIWLWKLKSVVGEVAQKGRGRGGNVEWEPSLVKPAAKMKWHWINSQLSFILLFLFPPFFRNPLSLSSSSFQPSLSYLSLQVKDLEFVFSFLLSSSSPPPLLQLLHQRQVLSLNF